MDRTELLTGRPMYYRHSGAVGPTGLVLVPGLALAAALVLTGIYAGVIYILIKTEIPYGAMLGALAGLGLGAMIGLAATWAGRIGKARNSWLVCGAAAAAGLLSLYLAWAAMVHFETGRWVWGLGDLLRIFAQGGDVILALLDAAMILFGAIACAYLFVGTTPFCEACGVWCRKESLKPFSPVDNPNALRADLESCNLKALSGFRRLEAAEGAWTEFELCTCPACENLRTLTIRATQTTGGKQPKVKTKTILKHLIVAREVHDLVRSLGKAAPAAPEAPVSPAAGRG